MGHYVIEYRVMVESSGCGVQRPGVEIVALLLISCVTSGKFFDLAEILISSSESGVVAVSNVGLS